MPENQHTRHTHPNPKDEELYYSMRRWRITLLLCLFFAFMMVLAVRIYSLTLLDGADYRNRSENNFVLENPLAAPRGRIVDRHGRLLALNRISFDITMSPYKLTRSQIASSVNRVSRLMNRPGIRERMDDLLMKRRVWESVTLADDLELDTVLPVLERSAQLPGVSVKRTYARSYPASSAMGHITGFVGGIDARKLDHFQALGYMRNERVGRIGAEKIFEPLLHGDHGREIIIRDRLGQPRQRYSDRPAEPGHTVHLTIDLRLQELAYSLLQGWHGTIIMLRPDSGEVLAMASRPSYDPNNPADLAEGRSQLNHATNSHSAPGSIFKIVTAAAALEAGFKTDEKISCQREFFLKGVKKPYRCHSRWGHGDITMQRSFETSCNVFFYNLAERLKAQPLYDMGRRFGFGQTTGNIIYSGDAESGGILLDPSGETIYPGEVLLMGIGQGRAIEVTPIQVARAYAALCNGGTLIRPQILGEVRGARGELVRRPVIEKPGNMALSDEVRDEIIGGLKAVVNGEFGTGRHVKFREAWKVAGKTSTAQLSRKKGDANAWFAGFAPWDNPQVVIVVLVVRAGNGGRMAAPLARQMLAAYFGEPEEMVRPPSLEKLVQPGGG